MRYISFCGRETAVIALGTMDFGGKVSEGQAFDFMDAYAEIGGNFIDTARIYGDFVNRIQGGSEQVIGRWMEARGNRSQIILGTKGAHPEVDTMHIGRLGREDILSDMQRSLDNLRTDCVDIYWLHRDDRSRPVQDILETLTELVENKMTRFVGVSNWKEDRILEANACAEARGLVKLYANQPQFSLARQAVVEDPTLCQVDEGMFSMHCSQGMPCVPFSSQAKGYLSKLAAGGEAVLPDKARRRYHHPENIAVFERAQALSRETGLSVSALALAWLTSQPFPTHRRREQDGALRSPQGSRRRRAHSRPARFPAQAVRNVHFRETLFLNIPPQRQESEIQRYKKRIQPCKNGLDSFYV